MRRIPRDIVRTGGSPRGAPDTPSVLLLSLGAATQTSTRSSSGRHRQLLPHSRCYPTGLSQSVRPLPLVLNSGSRPCPTPHTGSSGRDGLSKNEGYPSQHRDCWAAGRQQQPLEAWQPASWALMPLPTLPAREAANRHPRVHDPGSSMGSASDNICVTGNTVCPMVVKGPVRTPGEGGRGMELREKANGRFPHSTALGDQTGPLFCSAPGPSRALSPERGTQEALDSAEPHTPCRLPREHQLPHAGLRAQKHPVAQAQ